MRKCLLKRRGLNLRKLWLTVTTRVYTDKIANIPDVNDLSSVSPAFLVLLCLVLSLPTNVMLEVAGCLSGRVFSGFHL